MMQRNKKAARLGEARRRQQQIEMLKLLTEVLSDTGALIRELRGLLFPEEGETLVSMSMSDPPVVILPDGVNSETVEYWRGIGFRPIFESEADQPEGEL